MGLGGKLPRRIDQQIFDAGRWPFPPNGSVPKPKRWTPLLVFRACWRDEKGERESATLSEGSHGCSCYFAAGVHHRRSGGKSIFLGVKLEKQEGMKIERATQVRKLGEKYGETQACGVSVAKAAERSEG